VVVKRENFPSWDLNPGHAGDCHSQFWSYMRGYKSRHFSTKQRGVFLCHSTT